MAHIYVYSPSGRVFDRYALRRGVKRLQQRGHVVTLDEAVFASHQRFAGTDAQRLAAVHRAARSHVTHGADVTLISRGGYGMTRLLPRLDYTAIADSIASGVRWMGFSDFTALQLALLAHKGEGSVEGSAHTWAGAALCPDYGMPADAAPDELTDAFVHDVIDGISEGCGWRLKKQELELAQQHEDAQGYLVKKSLLWGGNLTVLTSLLGTPYFPQIKGGVLFLEDVAEHPYRIERALVQLHHAGVLQQQRAIVLGSFSGYTLSRKYERGFSMAKVVAFVREQLPEVPVFTGLPFGHTEVKVSLPVGKCVSVRLVGRELLLLW